MRATIILITALFSILFAGAQETMHPAGKYTEVFYIFNGTVHIGNGQVINNGIIKVSGTKIEAVGTDIVIPPGVPAIDARGQQVYPGQ